MAGPQFPDVPQTLGVPPVLRSPANPGGDTQPALPADQIVATAGGDRWGIYSQDNKLVLEPDSVTSINYSFEYRVADFPIEAGGFETYDKVETPIDVVITMTKGGTLADRRDFLAKLEEIKGLRDLYNVVTPERTYLNVNVTAGRIDRTREAGAGLISVEIHLREIRQTVTTKITKSADAASADVKNDGAVQATTPSAASAPPIVPNFATPTLGPVPALASAVPSFTPLAAIPMQAFPAQTLAVQLGGQLAQITVFQKRTGLFLDLSVNNVPIVLGAACLDRVPIIRNTYSPFVGNLAFVDIQGTSDPSFDGLADRFHLVWGT